MRGFLFNYFVSIDGVVIDARLVASLDIELVRAQLELSPIVGPLGAAYALWDGFSGSLRRWDLSTALVLRGLFSMADNENFRLMIETTWQATVPGRSFLSQ